MPGDVTVRMGPTHFIKKSHLLSVDREGMQQGEERLDAAMLPPQSPEQWRQSITQSTLTGGAGALPSAASGEPVRVPDLRYPERDVRLDAAPYLLGCSAD